jgi:hypothetical protein
MRIFLIILLVPCWFGFGFGLNPAAGDAGCQD